MYNEVNMPIDKLFCLDETVRGRRRANDGRRRRRNSRDDRNGGDERDGRGYRYRRTEYRDRKGGRRSKKLRHSEFFKEMFFRCRERYLRKQPWDRCFKGKKGGNGRNLVIIPAGDNSLHLTESNKWQLSLEKEKTGFDLCVVYYGKDKEVADRYKKNCKFFFEKQGSKWQLMRTILKEQFWKQYEFIWLPDDDLEISANDVSLMFKTANKHGLRMGQPSMIDENVVHRYKEILLKRKDCELHYTNFVEIMCPFFSVS